MTEWVTVARIGELDEDEMVSASVAGIELLVANVEGEYRSIGDVCTHEECSLAEGEIDEDTVTCACHGSMFDLRSGEVVAPPATEDEPVYEVRVEGDEIQVAKPGT
jgi:3-phenylpropionate/trans-cinnamate dioxygenase ferredoxin subunit